jgi:alcohol dehydrogenase class IV
MKPFVLAPSPLLYFGVGKFAVLPDVIQQFGTRVLLITGAKSFSATTHCHRLLDELQKKAITVRIYHVNNEPTPAIIDNAVSSSVAPEPDVVVAIGGGGSTLDTGKAVAAMLPLNESVKDYLEGVGTKAHPGTKVPFIAVPTTAGTGSEAAKNAVLSEIGENGYKRSLRHNNFVSNVAIVDPVLAITCPRTVTAASGMDAFTQLLESYLSSGGNTVTDALAWEGLQHVPMLLEAYKDGSNVDACTAMAIAAYLSGVTLTNAGLGIVHGFAASVGGYYDIPHGVICSTLMYASNKVTVRKLRSSGSNPHALTKYSNVGKLFCHEKKKSDDYYIDFFLSMIANWVTEMNIPRLAAAGVPTSAIKKIVEVTENKNNPVALSKEEMVEILEGSTS